MLGEPAEAIANRGLPRGVRQLNLGRGMALPEFQRRHSRGGGKGAAGQLAFPVAVRAALGEQRGAGFRQGALQSRAVEAQGGRIR